VKPQRGEPAFVRVSVCSLIAFVAVLPRACLPSTDLRNLQRRIEGRWT